MAENLVLALFAFLPCLWAGLLWLLATRLRRQKGRLDWRALALGNVLVLFLLLSGLLLGGEVYYRFIYDTSDSMAYTKTCQEWFRRHWRVNSQHIRDDTEPWTNIGAGKRRVTFLGDSFAAGHGIKRVEDRFVNQIRRAHPEWEVHTLAVPGFDTGEEQAFLTGFLKGGYQIDLVVLVYCLNDVADLLPGRDAGFAHLMARRAGRSWLERHSFFLDTVCHRLDARWDPYLKDYYGFVREGYRGAVWEKQKQRLKELRDQVQSNGGHLVVVTFPFMHALGPNYDWRPVHDGLNAYWGELRVPNLDLLSTYAGLKAKQLTVSSYDAHPNEYAHALAAQAIDKFLKERLAAIPRQSAPAAAVP